MKLHHFPLILSLLIVTATIAQEKDIKKIDSIAQSFSNKAWDYMLKGNDSVLYFTDKGISYSKANNSTYGEMINLEMKGIYLEEVLNDYEAAIKNYVLAIHIAEQYHKNYLPNLYNELCILFIVTNDKSRGLSYCELAVEKSKERTETKTVALHNLAIMQSKLREYKKSNATFKTYLEIKNLTQWQLTTAKSGIGNNFKRQKKYKKAIIYFKEAIASDSLKGQKKYGVIYTNLIVSFIKLKDKKNVSKYLPILNKSFHNIKSLSKKQPFYATMSNAFKVLEKYKTAIIYKDSLIEINKIITKKKYDKGIVDADIKYQTEKKDILIKEETGKRKFWLTLSSLSFLTLCIVGFSLYKNNQKRKQLTTSKKSLEIALNQRNMLLKETHHRVKNSFQMVSSLLKLQARGSKAAGAVAALENAVQRVNSMIILHQQLYAKDNILGIDLKVYIKDLITEITSSYQTENITIDQQILSTTVNIDTATSIGLLINELATNSIKHGWKKDFENKTITIQIEKTNELLYFEMFDNGIHLKDNSVKTGYGSELINILIKRLKASKLKVQENSYSIHLEIPLQTNEA